MEIGSIYEINPDSVKAEGTGTLQELHLAGTAKYGKKYCSYTASGREAIALALKSLEQNRPGIPRRCLLPAYMCDTVFFPFMHAGWKIYFYHLNKRLAASEEEVRSLMEQVRPGLLFIHPYYGVDTWKPMRPLLAEWKRQGICIMEDVTQSYYLEEAGKEADYVVGSLRKWYPVPDGGFVAAEEALFDGETEGAEAYAGMRLEALEEKWRYLNGQESPEKKRERKAGYLKRNRELEEELDRFAGIRRISGITLRILQETDEAGAQERRNANYKHLYKNLCGKTQFEPVLQETAPGEEAGGEPMDVRGPAPLYFPIYAKERDGLQNFLGAHDIYAPVLWLPGEKNGDCLSAEEKEIYSQALALPMDQRYGAAEMRRLVEVMEEYERRKAEGSGSRENGRTKRGKEGGQVIGIRADANGTVATGHIMRCITIARQLVKKGGRVIFFTADEYARCWLEQAGMETVCLHSRWDDMEGEIPLLRKELIKADCRKLLVDSYQASAEYFGRLRDLCRLVYIDDCFEEVYPVDLLVNYNAYQVRFPYGEAYRGKAKLLLGTQYVPLREEFRREEFGREEFGREEFGREEFGREEFGREGGLPRSVEGQSRGMARQQAQDPGRAEEDFGSCGKNGGTPHIMLSSGGGDACNALEGILAEAVQDAQLCHAVFHVAVGKFHSGRERLEQLAKAHPGIRLHCGVTQMAGLMASCDAAVSAAGTMLFELSAMTVPTVFFVSADNQQYDSEFFAEGDRMLFAGDIRADRQGCMERICCGLKRILRDGELRRKMKKALRHVADGKGAERIAEAVLEL